MRDKFKEFLSLCKCSVTLEVNKHRDYYESAEKYLDDLANSRESPLEIDAETRAKMIETNTIINLNFYPNTPIGFHDIYGYDLDMLLEEAVWIILKIRGVK